ncbi:hypothetical protein XENOCAPTIV_006462 [Xenoophorus captivus]|uniref:Uncharacterized protein n=1 Tax=Xenoophorus captivus TaxID=1517983 RepID=A0ABV0RPL7_9TELE
MDTPLQVSFIPEKPTRQQPDSASSTHSPAPSTPHHCNDSPDRNIIQLSSTTAAQPIQMPVTPHPTKGHNLPTPHTAAPTAPSSLPSTIIFEVEAASLTTVKQRQPPWQRPRGFHSWSGTLWHTYVNLWHPRGQGLYTVPACF